MTRAELTLHILLDLIKRKHCTMSELAKKYDKSPRTIYRCCDDIGMVLPIVYKRGARGGVFLVEFEQAED